MNALTVLLPKTRAEIVRLLFADSRRELHQRELARLSQLAIRSIQNEVEKLVAAELICARRDGNRLYFRANKDHPIFPELHSIALKTSGLAERIARSLADLETVEIAFIYGSIAAGDASATSDIDLMVIGDIGLRQLAPRLRPLTEEMGREINPTVYSKANFQAKARSDDAFVNSVLKSQKTFIKGEEDELSAMA